MLEIKNISKTYTTGDFTQKALDNVSIKFRKKEFVSILGASGSGKTTLLNIVSGLDRYDDGDLIINNKSTSSFKSSDWDAYRNNCIGFVFQSYNLITHISILDNVEMGLTLSGVPKNIKRKKAIEALTRVGLKKHINKKPNQLSGGQMQRVAIARAIVNDPDVVLADEPTGALDSKTSVEVMELIKEISSDELVIMVTHNRELAEKYSSRIIELSDGKVISDSNPIKEATTDKIWNIKKTAMGFLSALSLSFNNIKTKKGRTLLTAFASSIGIIGISTILALSNGFDKQIDEFETEALGSFPISISQQAVIMDEEKMKDLMKEYHKSEKNTQIIPYNSAELDVLHTNKIDQDYINYIENIDKSYTNEISYYRVTGLNLLNNSKPVQSSNLNMQSLPKALNNDISKYMTTNYDLLQGNIPKDKNELLLFVDNGNRIDTSILETLGFDIDKNLDYKDIIGKELTLIMNDDFYQKMSGFYLMKQDFEAMKNSKKSITLKIVGIVKPKENNDSAVGVDYNSMMNSATTGLKGGILYTNELIEYVLENNNNSEIVKAQKKANNNLLTGETLTNNEEKKNLLLYLGGDYTPIMINIYPSNFEAKKNITKYLDNYNDKLDDSDKIVYTDYANMMINMAGGIMDSITYVLIAFSAVSLVVSGIMIGIITYISVLERTKEIGILRSLGARKKDISRVFNAETFIIGLGSGMLGVGIAYALTFPINILLENLTGLEGVSSLNPLHAFGMVILSILITLVGGFIPAKIAARKDPVIALRTE